MRTLTVAAALTLCAVALYAQSTTPLPCSSNCVLQKGQPFAVVYDWAPTTLNPDMADGFRLYQNGVLLRTATTSALQNGVIAFGFQVWAADVRHLYLRGECVYDRRRNGWRSDYRNHTEG